MNKEELIEAIAFAKEQGLSSISVGNITMTIPKEISYEIKEPTPSELNLAFNQEEISEEEILYYATPYYDELQEKKKRQLETIKEDEDKRG
jgi:hypothetical protein